MTARPAGRLFAAGGALLAVLACSRAVAPDPFVERKLASLPKDRWHQLAVSQDGSVAAWGEQRSEREDDWAVMVNGKAVQNVPHVCSLTLSADGKSLAAMTHGDQAANVVIWNGKPGAMTGMVRFPLTLSPDGSTLAYEVQREKKRYVVINNQPLGPFDEALGPLIIAPDHRTVGTYFSVTRRVLIDGKTYEIQDPASGTLTAIALAADGKLAAYALSDVEGSSTVVFGQKRWSVSYEVASLVLLDHGTSLAWAGYRDDKRFPVVDGKELDGIEKLVDLVTAPDGSLAYRATDGKELYLVHGTRKARLEGSVSDLPYLFSPDGTRVAYATLLGNDLWWKVAELR